MTYDRDRFIAAQNAASVAATLLTADAGEQYDGVDHIMAMFEDIRTRIFLGTLDLAEVPGAPEEVAAQFPGSTFVGQPQVPQQPWVPPVPPTAPPYPGAQQYHQPPAPASPPPPPAAGGVPSCPDCNGPMWDNRSTKKGNQPDFKCKDRQCGKGVWLNSRRG